MLLSVPALWQLLARAGLVVALVASASAATWTVRVLAPDAMFLFFVAAVALATWSAGTAGGTIATILSVIAVDLLFVDPVGALGVPTAAGFARVASFALVAGTIVWLTHGLQRARKRAEAIAQDEGRARKASDRASEAKDQFVSTLSHEIRTPLTAIVGYADLFEAGVGGPVSDAHREYVSRLHMAADHLLRVVNDLLDIAKADAGRLALRNEVAKIEPTIDAAMTLVLPQATRKGIAISVARSGDAVAYRGDPGRVRQILVNLLGNAVKFTPGGGSVVVTRGAQDDRAWISIADTGPGVPEIDQARIFEWFEQTGDLHSEGTGLGLAISRRLARLMQGELTLQSADGKGATFTLWLPRA